MKTGLICASLAAVIVASTPPCSAQRQDITLPYTFGPNPADPQGQANGININAGGIGLQTLTVSPGINFNTSGFGGGAVAIMNNIPASLASALFNGSSNLTGSTGSVANNFLSIGAGAAGSTVNFGGPVFATTFNAGPGTVNINGLLTGTTLNVAGTGTVNLNGGFTGAAAFGGDGFISVGAGQTFAGAITNASGVFNMGTVTLNGGSNVVGAVGGAPGLPVKLINVVGGNAEIGGAVFTSGFGLGANTLTITGALTTSIGTAITTTLGSNVVFGHVDVNGANNHLSVLAPGITVTPTVTGVVTVGTIFTVIDGKAAGTPGIAVTAINTPGSRYTFSGLPTEALNGGDVRIRLDAIAPLAAPGAPPVGPILDNPAPPGSDLATVQNALAALTTVAATNAALAQLTPSAANLGAPWVAAQATRLFEDLWMARIEEIQDLCCDACDPGKPGQPVNAHRCKGSEQRSNWWAKGFGNRGRQGDVDSVSGYQTRAEGVMLAWDAPLNNQTRIGVGGAFANTDVDGNNSIGSTKIDSYQVTGYLSHAPGPWFAQGSLTVGVDKYSGSRPIVFTGVNRVASADYTGQQYTGLVSAGRHFPFGQATVTPLASLQVSRIRVDSYTESGADSVNLRVSNQDYNFVQSSLGVKAERVFQSGNGTVSPEAHFKWLHDFSSTTMRQDAAFTSGGGVFTADGVKQDKDLFNVGAGFTFLSCKCGEKTWTVKGLYDYRWNQSNYSSHQLSVIASLKF